MAPVGDIPSPQSGIEMRPRRVEHAPAEGEDHRASEDFVEDYVATNAYYRDVVDATAVTTVLSEREEEDLMRRRQRRYLWIGGCTCFAIALAIIIPLLTVPRGSDGPEIIVETQLPRTSPTAMPSEAPTSNDIPDSISFTIDLIRQSEVNTVWETEEWWNDPSSAPFRAALWLHETSSSTESNTLIQRYALATLYYATSGEASWEDCRYDTGSCPEERWLSNEDECKWGFVTCDSVTGAVRQLNFPQRGNGLRGTLPPQLSLLSELQVFAIANNQIAGGNSAYDASIQPTNDPLTDDSPSTTWHSVDQAFYGLTSLQLLNLYENSLTGSLPSRIWKTNPDLNTVFLGQNQFSGSLPEVSAATNLQVLHVASNFLTGSVPSTLGLLNASLLSLQLEDNRFDGNLPVQLFALTQLTSLTIGNNTQLLLDFRDTGEQFAQLSNLQEFEASFTQLQGTLSKEIFYGLTAMSIWDTESTLLSGTLPGELSLWNASLTVLNLENNQLTGALPESLGALTRLEELKLKGNGFVGAISSTICGRKGTRFGELGVLTASCSVNCSCCDQREEECN